MGRVALRYFFITPTPITPTPMSNACMLLMLPLRSYSGGKRLTVIVGCGPLGYCRCHIEI